MSARRGAFAAALVVALAVHGGAAPAQASSAADVEVLPSEAGTLRLSVTAQDLPPGASLDPSSVRVVVDGARWPASAVVTGGTLERRSSVLVVDTSGSMGDAGIAAARAAGERYLAAVSGDVAVGLVTFSEQASLVVRPTTDRSAVRAALAGMRPAGSTALYDGLLLALEAQRGLGATSLVLLSDGEDTASTADLSAAAAALSASGASVDLVSFGADGGQRAALDSLAAAAGGRVTQADDASSLSSAFTAAARTLVDEVTVTAQVPEGAAGTTAGLRVEVDAGATTVGATREVELAPLPLDTTGTVAGAPTAVGASVPWLLPATVGTAFLALFAVFALLAVAFAPPGRADSASARRVRDVQRYTVSTQEVAVGPVAPAALTVSALAWAGRRVQARGLEASWRLQLDRAGVPLRPQEWFLIRLSVALVGAAGAVVMLPWWLFTAPAVAIAFWSASGLYVRIKAARRVKRFADELPDVLQLIAGSLRTGFSLPQAVDNAARDGEQPMAGELARALSEARLGVELEDALDRVAERMRSTDLAWTVMAVRIAREVGGNLAEVLLSTAETMRERGRIHRQVRALSAEGRLSAYVLIGLPLGITVFMVLFRRSYIAPLVTDPIGWLMTGYGVVSVVVGAFVMSRLCKLEV